MRRRRTGGIGAGMALVALMAGAALAIAVAVQTGMRAFEQPAAGQRCDAVADTVTPRADLVCALDGSGDGYRWRAR